MEDIDMSYGVTDWTTTYPTPFGTLNLDQESFEDYTDDQEDTWDELQWTDQQIDAFERRDLNSLDNDEDESSDTEDYPEVEEDPYVCSNCGRDSESIAYSPEYGWDVCSTCRNWALEEW